jgi:hypothetical protein
MIKDDRPSAREITFGLVFDVIQVLDDHGYQRPTEPTARHRSWGRIACAISDLIQAYTGQDHHKRTDA